MVGVVAHKRGQIEGNRKPSTPVFEQIFVALIGFLGRGKAGKLAHSKKLAAISGGVNATREGRLAGIAEILVIVPVLGKIRPGVHAADGYARNCGEARMPVLVEIGTRWRTDWPLWSLLQGRRQSSLRPLFLGV